MKTNQNTAAATIYTREGAIGRNLWQEIVAVVNSTVVIFNMERTMFGWALASKVVQGETEWPGMDTAAIVAWKAEAAQTDTCRREATADERAFALARI